MMYGSFEISQLLIPTEIRSSLAVTREALRLPRSGVKMVFVLYRISTAKHRIGASRTT